MDSISAIDENTGACESAEALAAAAVRHVVERHEASIAALREAVLTSPAVRDASDHTGCERERSALRAELATLRETAVSHAPQYARDDAVRAREALARAQATIRAQACEIERLAAEIAARA